MYGRAIRFATNKTVHKSTAASRVYFSSSVSTSTQPNHKDPNLVDDIRDSASGMPPVAESGAADHRVNVVKTSPTPGASSGAADHRVNVVKTSTTPSSSSSNKRESENGTGSYVADSVKQGVVKAIETGLEIGEMAKKTLDNVWDVTKDTSHQVKKAVAGDEERKYDVPPTDHFVDDLRKRGDGYDRRRNK